MSLNFGKTTCRDHLRELEELTTALRKEVLNSSLGTSAAIKAWSICDWAIKEAAVSSAHSNLRELQTFVRNNSPALNLLQDIANSDKHKDITNYVPELKSSQRKGGFSRDFSSDFVQAGLEVTGSSGQNYLLDDLLLEAIDFWDNFLSSFGI